MKNQASVQHLMGTNTVFDPKTQINISLPPQNRIYIRTNEVWIGGREDGSSYLLIERISAQALELTRPLAGGDLDIRVYPRGPGRQLDEGVISQQIKCEIRQETLSGLWIRAAYDEQYHYLILLAAKEAEQFSELQATALQIGQRINAQAPKRVQLKKAVAV